jgi:hypothetical protein
VAFKRTKYRAVNAAKLKERGSRTSSRFDNIFIDNITQFKAAAGTNILRLVKDPDADYFGEVIWVHSYVGVKNSTYLCLKKMKEKPCPICDMADEANRAGDKDERYQLEAKERVIAYVIDRQDEKAGLKVWDMSWTMERDVADACINKRTGGHIDIAHPDTGYDIFFQRQGKTKNNTRYFGLQIDRESTPLSENQRQADDWVDEVQERPLLSLLKYKDAEYLADMLSGKVDEKDEEEETTKRRQERTPTRRSKYRDERVEQEEDDEPEESEEEGNGEDETGAPPSRRGSRDARDRETERPMRGSSRRASDRDSEEDEGDGEDGRGRRGRFARTAERDEDDIEEDKPCTPSRVSRRQAEDNEPDDTDEDNGRGKHQRSVERGRDHEAEQEAEAGEARRWARGRRNADAENQEEEEPPRRVERRQRLYPRDEVDNRDRRRR